jgi:hypothetical protein
MKLHLAVEIGDHTVAHQLDTKDQEMRQDLRNAMADLTIRLELALFGPPLDVELSRTDTIYHFKSNDG